MSDIIEINIPDLGGASDVDVIEVLVKVGDSVMLDDSLITLESDKASMDIPAPKAGTISKAHVAVGDKVNEGDLIFSLELASAEPTATNTPKQTTLDLEPKQEQKPSPTAETPQTTDNADSHASLVVIGSGPGGYTAAFRAADLGLDVTLIERYDELGGVCLNVGCIPSKALLHTADVISQAREMRSHGVSFGEPDIDLEQLRGFKESVVSQLTNGLAGMAKARKVKVIKGYARFTSAHTLSIEQGTTTTSLSFDQAIIAAGSRVSVLPMFKDLFANNDPRIIDSTGALNLKDIPENMLIVGGGIIGLEMATVYAELGTRVSIVEYLPQIIPGADKDLIQPLNKRLKGLLTELLLSTKVDSVEPQEHGIKVNFAAANDSSSAESKVYDMVLVATGRRPNGDVISAEQAGVTVDEQGFIAVDEQMRTNQAHIFAIGDIVGQPMLAHKATHQAKVAAQVCAGEKSSFDAQVIPSVAYTNPEVAWVGLTETQAKQQGIDYQKGVFPWAASGRAIGNARTEGKTKLLFDPNTHRVIGGGIVGTNAGDLIAEVAHAIEMGSDASDIGLTIHPHPTLSETVAMAAEIYEGTITDLYLPKKPSAK